MVNKDIYNIHRVSKNRARVLNGICLITLIEIEHYDTYEYHLTQLIVQQ